MVGTHALVQEGVEFRRLGLVVVDEQHRFGVAQRARLRAKGEHPDVLVMTATPIPRTLALTLYGDLDVVVLDELPPGRQPIVTVARTESKRRADLRLPARAGGRAAARSTSSIRSSRNPRCSTSRRRPTWRRQLQHEVFPDLVVGLLHGRLAFEDKDAIMRRFKAGEIHVLVSTTVIEVGIDVPNASVMLIEHAERFGLSQLHQLRGRVGRGPWKSYCILLTERQLGEDARAADATRWSRPNDGFRSPRSIWSCAGRASSSARASRGCPSSAWPICCATPPSSRRRGGRRSPSSRADPELRAPEHRGLRASAAGALARQARAGLRRLGRASEYITNVC